MEKSTGEPRVTATTCWSPLCELAPDAWLHDPAPIALQYMWGPPRASLEEGPIAAEDPPRVPHLPAIPSTKGRQRPHGKQLRHGQRSVLAVRVLSHQCGAHTHQNPRTLRLTSPHPDELKLKPYAHVLSHVQKTKRKESKAPVKNRSWRNGADEQEL